MTSNTQSNCEGSYVWRNGKNKVGGVRYKARSRGRSSPDTLAFWACETPRRYSRLLPGFKKAIMLLILLHNRRYLSIKLSLIYCWNIYTTKMQWGIAARSRTMWSNWESWLTRPRDSKFIFRTRDHSPLRRSSVECDGFFKVRFLLDISAYRSSTTELERKKEDFGHSRSVQSTSHITDK